MADANMPSSSLVILLLSLMLPAACEEVSSTIAITDDCSLTLISSADEIYISRPLLLTLSASLGVKTKSSISTEAIEQIKNKHIDLTISTNRSEVIGIPAEKTTDLLILPLISTMVFNVTFPVTSNMSLFTDPINVTVTATEKGDSDKSMSISLLLFDDRVDVGFFHNETTCISNGACFLEIIAKMTPTVSDIYITLSVPDAEAADEETFPVAGYVPKLIHLGTTEDFTAALSVPKKCERKVYLSRQEMLIRVTPNKLVKELKDLKDNYTKLWRNYTALSEQFQNLSNFTMAYVHKSDTFEVSTSPPSPAAEDSTTIELSTTGTDLTTDSPTTSIDSMTDSQTTDSPTTDSESPTSTPSVSGSAPTTTKSETDEGTQTTTTASPSVAVSELPNDNTLLYGGLMAFIAVLVVCVAAYLLYHNKEKLLEMIGGKKESVVEMAMKSRSKKSKGYQKLPTSIHDTMTHED